MFAIYLIVLILFVLFILFIGNIDGVDDVFIFIYISNGLFICGNVGDVLFIFNNDGFIPIDDA